MSTATERRPTEIANWRGRLAAHEAGHSVAAYLLGGRVGHCSIRPTRRWGGVARAHPRKVPARDLDRLDVTLPYVCLPPRLRTSFEIDALISLAGPLAEKRYGPEFARHPLAGAEPPRKEPHRRDLPAVERRALEAGNSRRKPLETDDERARESLRVLAPLHADLLYELFREMTVQLVGEHKFRCGVEALAPELLEHTDLSGAEVRRILTEAMKRPNQKEAVPDAITG